jgi:hypothetical protein
MPMFIRFLASDQYFQFIQPPKKWVSRNSWWNKHEREYF